MRNRAGACILALGISSAYLAIVDFSLVAVCATALAVFLTTQSRSLSYRIALVVTCFLSQPLGYGLLLLVLPLWLSLHSLRLALLGSIVGFLTWQYGSQIGLLLPATTYFHLGSLTFLAISSVATAFILYPLYGVFSVCRWTMGVVFVALMVVASAIGGFLTADILSDSIFRLFLVVAPALALFGTLMRNTERDASTLETSSLIRAFCYSFAFAMVLLIIGRAPIDRIYFDEAHGRWETVLESFKPDDFGRGHYYTYSELFEYSKSLVHHVIPLGDETVPSSTDSLYVLKMPTVEVSERYAKQLWSWIGEGGRLLIIADHTNLYDTSRYLNAFLSYATQLRIADTAVFDSKGMPNRVHTRILDSVLGRIEANGMRLDYQTGASFQKLPIFSLILASYGLSFSEPGDYARPNRFGTFLPRLQIPYQQHPSILSIPYGHGMVVAVTDSTPWSNFSVPNLAYQRLFSAILEASAHPWALKLSAWGSAVLVLLAIILALVCERKLMMFATVIYSCVMSATTIIGVSASFSDAPVRKDAVHVTSGQSATYEYLSQLVPISKRNYARVVGSLGKYGLPAVVIPYGYANDGDEKYRLFIEPEPEQLPTASVLVDEVRRGSLVTMLFHSSAAGDPRIQNWLNRLGMVIRVERGNALSEGMASGLLARDGLLTWRLWQPVSSAKPNSWWANVVNTPLFQVYRPRNRYSEKTNSVGRLVLSFSSEQFSDMAIGDVWEGVYPTWLGRQRERQLAALMRGKEPENETMPINDVIPLSYSAALPNFAIIEDGKPLLSGKLEKPNTLVNSDSLGINPYGYLNTLQYLVLRFIDEKCDVQQRKSVCEEHFFAHDLTEWVVRYQADVNGVPNAVELLHERRFSGLRSTYNVIFSKD